MDIVATKILIMFGLLILTLAAALLPLFCLMLTTHHKRRRRHNQGRPTSFCHKICLCGSSAHADSNGNHDCKVNMENESVRTTQSETRRTKFRKKLLVSVLNCFAGGIFLGTSFIGLLPEIRETFEEFDIRWPDLASSSAVSANSTSEEPGTGQMPIAEIIVVLGLFFILCIEQGAHSWNHWRLRRKNPNHGHHHHHHHHGKEMLVLRTATPKDDDLSVEESGPSTPLPPSPSLSEVSDTDKPAHDHSGIRSLMLVATLSIHSLLEGMAIGLQIDLGSIVVIFVAVLFHKSLMAFSMGSNLVHSKQSTKKLVMAAAIFALASPIGIAIGLIIHSQQEGGPDSVTKLVNAILQAIATGTFLYITFFEVLVKEFEAHGNRLAKVLALFVGYGSVLITFLFAQH